MTPTVCWWLGTTRNIYYAASAGPALLLYPAATSTSDLTVTKLASRAAVTPASSVVHCKCSSGVVISIPLSLHRPGSAVSYQVPTNIGKQQSTGAFTRLRRNAVDTQARREIKKVHIYDMCTHQPDEGGGCPLRRHRDVEHGEPGWPAGMDHGTHLQRAVRQHEGPTSTAAVSISLLCGT